MTGSTQPEANELEVSVFGRGYGECIVAHLGAGAWMVVDSCLCARNTQPVAIEYLSRIGVSVKEQLRLIVVSHWHDDHIRGASALVKAAPQAKFGCSIALRRKEFLQLVEAGGSYNLVESSSGTKEFARIVSMITDESYSHAGISWVRQDLPVYRTNDPFNVEVLALSPSDQTITNAFREFAELIPKQGDARTRLPDTSPNSLSVVLQLRVGPRRVLLGGDLETGGDDRLRGWNAILSSQYEKSHVYKVPHHGSPNADSDAIWEQILEPSPWAALTPFVRGNVQLPTRKDLTRLVSRTTRLYCTSWPLTRSPLTRDRAVDRTMKEVTVRRRSLPKKVGHIRFRAPIETPGEDFRVELFDGARLIQSASISS